MSSWSPTGWYGHRSAIQALLPAEFPIDYAVESTGTSEKQSKNLRLNLYFDSVRRSEELVQLDIDITEQHKKLQLLLLEQEPLEDDQSLKRHFRYFKLQYDSGERLLKSFTRDDKKVEKARRNSGFFSIMTHKLDIDAMQTYQTYKLRDEQEKAFQQMKSQMVADRQRTWSEEGKTGRLFILFVSMVLGSAVRHTWKTTELHALFSSSLDVLDEMRSIRCIEHTGRAKFIAPFVASNWTSVKLLDSRFLKAVPPTMFPGRNILRNEVAHASKRPKWIYSIKGLKIHINKWEPTPHLFSFNTTINQ